MSRCCVSMCVLPYSIKGSESFLEGVLQGEEECKQAGKQAGKQVCKPVGRHAS